MVRVILLLALLVFAGCLDKRDDDGSPGVPVEGRPGLSKDLTAAGAEELRNGDNLVFVWEGELGAGAEVPLATGSLLNQYDSIELQVPVDETVKTITVIHGGSDVSIAMLRDGDGHLMCAVRNFGRCASLVNATSGTWPLRITSLAPGGLSYMTLVELSPAVPVLADDGLSAADFDVHRTTQNGGEPTMAWTNDEAILIVAGTTVQRLDPDAPTNSSFTDVTPPIEATASQTLDPFLVGDPLTGRIYLTQLASCMRLSWTDDAGESWTTNPLFCGGPDQHHQKMAVGPGPVARALHIGTMNLASWLATQDVVITHSRSLDGGITWVQTEAMVPPIHGMEARAIGNIAVADDGTVLIVAYLCDEFVDAEYKGLAVGRSTNGGITWEWDQVAGGGGLCEGIDPGIWTSGNAVHIAWEEHIPPGGGNVWHASSPDSGATWNEPTMIPTGALSSFVFTDVAAGTERVAAAFLATADTVLGPTQAPGWARWYPYVAILNVTDPDAGWQVSRLQEDPVQIGPICMIGPMCLDGARNLLDFIDVQISLEGRIGVAYADGCEQECELPWQSRGSDLRVAVERTGPLSDVLRQS